MSSRYTRRKIVTNNLPRYEKMLENRQVSSLNIMYFFLKPLIQEMLRTFEKKLTDAS